MEETRAPCLLHAADSRGRTKTRLLLLLGAGHGGGKLQPDLGKEPERARGREVSSAMGMAACCRAAGGRRGGRHGELLCRQDMDLAKVDPRSSSAQGRKAPCCSRSPGGAGRTLDLQQRGAASGTGSLSSAMGKGRPRHGWKWSYRGEEEGGVGEMADGG